MLASKPLFGPIWYALAINGSERLQLTRPKRSSRRRHSGATNRSLQVSRTVFEKSPYNRWAYMAPCLLSSSQLIAFPLQEHACKIFPWSIFRLAQDMVACLSQSRLSARRTVVLFKALVQQRRVRPRFDEIKAIHKHPGLDYVFWASA